MARYAYDVNTTTRLIDVHKQFNGGLKTVDTDDALGAVFLRDAQNISLSEFGFIEKRYGTFEDFKQTVTGTLQGYWEFQGHLIFAANGKLYVDDFSEAVTLEKEDEDWRYPEETFSTLQSTREMSAVNINNVLYIFTGTYPVYVKLVEDELKFFLFSIDIPSYDEIVVVGHNLLEDDYEGLYGFKTPNSYDTGSYKFFPFTGTEPDPKIISNNFYPRIPYVNGEDSGLNFVFDYDFPITYKYGFVLDGNPGPTETSTYYKADLKSIKYRNSGAGSSDLDFIDADISDVNFSPIDNYTGSDDLFIADEGYLLNKTLVKNTELDLETFEFAPTGTTNYTTVYSILKKNRFSVSQIKLDNMYSFQFFKSTGDANEPFEAILFEDLVVDDPSLPHTPELYIEIVPYDSNGDLFEDSKLVIPQADISKNNKNYNFLIPKDVSSSDFVFGYEIRFFESFEVSHGEESEPPYTYSDFFVSFLKVNEITALRNFSDNPLLDFSFNNLISGTFDFEITFSVEKYTNNGSGFLVFEEERVVSSRFNNITITPERLEDFPRKDKDSIGIEYPKLHPIWSCNKVIEHFGKLMVWGSTDEVNGMPTAVFYSFPDRPTFFPSKFYLDFTNDENNPIEAVTNFMNILVVQTEDRTWGVRGNSGYIDSPAPYTPFTINPTVGALAWKSVRPVRNHLLFLSKQGIIALKSLYAADEQYNIEFVDRNIFNIVPRDRKAVGIQYDNQYWLNFPNYGITLRWYIDKKAWVLDRYTAWTNFKGVFKYQVKDGGLEFITYPSNYESVNPVLGVYRIGIDESLATDLTGDIHTFFETSFLNQNYPFHHKNYKEFKYDFTLQNEYNTSKEAVFSGTLENNTITGLEFLRNHQYKISFENEADLESVTMGEEINVTAVTEGSYYVEGNFDFIFTVPNSVTDLSQITLNFGEAYTGDLEIRDISYDLNMTFFSKIISEERQILNQQLPIGYEEQQEAIAIDLEDFQDYTFGSTALGDRVTFVKTIKLSGRGYNAKAYFEDTTKSKWTIESMGITYKMRKARSR